MSCGNPHATDCREVIARVHGYLDGELDGVSAEQVRQHLQECAPCLSQFDIEQVIKAMVARSCACEPAPTELRENVVARLTEIRLSYTRVEVWQDGPQQY